MKPFAVGHTVVVPDLSLTIQLPQNYSCRPNVTEEMFRKSYSDAMEFELELESVRTGSMDRIRDTAMRYLGTAILPESREALLKQLDVAFSDVLLDFVEDAMGFASDVHFYG